MKQLLEMIKKTMQAPDYRRYDAVHRAMGAMEAIKEEHGHKKLYSAADVLELLELVAMDPDRRE